MSRQRLGCELEGICLGYGRHDIFSHEGYLVLTFSLVMMHAHAWTVLHPELLSADLTKGFQNRDVTFSDFSLISDFFHLHASTLFLKFHLKSTFHMIFWAGPFFLLQWFTIYRDPSPYGSIRERLRVQ